jgi:Predicted Zn peptidase
MDFNILEVIWNRSKCEIPRNTDKKTLYKKVQDMRKLLGIELDDYPINIFEILQRLKDIIDISYENLSLKLGGILIINEQPYKSAMLINSKRNKTFSAAHELVHYLGHSENDTYLHLQGNSEFIEWQANEGAAEFLLPYKLFIPDFYNLSKRTFWTDEIIQILAEQYNVSTGQVATRIKSLEYEIKQYFAGVDIDKVVIMSKRKYEQELIYGKELRF